MTQKYLEKSNDLTTEIELINFLEVPYELQLETRNWRNCEKVAKWFKIPYINEATHIKWLESLKNDSPRNIAFIIKYKNEFIGVTYFHSIDYKKEEGDWGIYIYDENNRGHGFGYHALSESIKFAFETLKLKTLYLDVLNTNERAKKLYTKKGFKLISDKDTFLRYKLINNQKVEL